MSKQVFIETSTDVVYDSIMLLTRSRRSSYNGMNERQIDNLDVVLPINFAIQRAVEYRDISMTSNSWWQIKRCKIQRPSERKEGNATTSEGNETRG